MLLWSNLYAATIAGHAEEQAAAAETTQALATELASATAKIEQLSAVLSREADQAQTSEVRAMLETDLVKNAERKTDAALLRYDRAMAALWRIGQRHTLDATAPRPNQPLRCSCGTPVTECVEWAALESVRQLLEAWESKQRRHLAAGERSALPAEHPAARGAEAGSPRNSTKRR